MMAARVAGVPMPQSLSACRASSSSTPSRPAVSIAASSELSVCRGFGRVMPELIEHPAIASVSPSFQSGSIVSSLSSPYTLRQPSLRTMHPFASNATPQHSASTLVVSFTHSGENASTMRLAIMS